MRSPIARKVTIETYTLTMIGKDGLQIPIGAHGAPAFHVFHDWEKVQAAIANVVATVGLDSIHAIAKTMTQTYGGKLVDFTATHYSQSEVAEICERFASKSPA